MENEEKKEQVEKEEVKPKKGVKKLQEELDKALLDAEENKRKWYAVTAEYENYRRRTQNQSAQRYQEGRNDVIASLFPIGDNLERALASITDESTKQGLDMILKAYKKVLDGEGVEEIDPTGQPFNADFAEAIMAMPAENGEESGIVKQVYVKGYKKGDKVLRYAQVIVTQ
ncbi:MAG: nucleotide exchange factor GrpE [Clostridia bacterium]|nr:nucleotide exchange factor GrpE [Clostridia bacterium]